MPVPDPSPSPDEVRRALRSPRAYRPAPPSVEVVETHVSHVFLAGDRVYKVKKPLRLPFVDASTLERREFLCHEEVRLNRRLAGEVYRGVQPIVVDPEGRVSTFGEGRVVDFAVVMDRLPEARMLDALLARGEVDHELLDRLVERLVRFDEEAARGEEVAAFGRPEAVAEMVLSNLEEWFGSGRVPEAIANHLRTWARRTLEEAEPLLERRFAEGRIREGHGDLHAGNVCVLGDRIVAYDCIEFAPAFRCVDVAAEVAFLSMDLASRGFLGFAEAFTRRYAARAEDPGLRDLQPLYRVHYAAVRAKVAGLLAADANAPEAARREAQVRETAASDLAVRLTLPPFLAITCGLPGSGKSTVARALGAATEAFVLRSDVERKRLAGVPPTERCIATDEAGIYAPEFSDRVYDHLLRCAEERLAHGRSVIVDAAFPTAARRAPFLDGARRLGAPFVVVELHTPEDVALARLRARAADSSEPSDAGEEVHAAARGRFEPPEELEGRHRLEVPAGEPLERVVARFVRRLIDAVPRA